MTDNPSSRTPNSYALVTDIHQDNCLQVSYRDAGQEFSMVFTLDEATHHATAILKMVKQLRQRARRTRHTMFKNAMSQDFSIVSPQIRQTIQESVE